MHVTLSFPGRLFSARLLISLSGHPSHISCAPKPGSESRFNSLAAVSSSQDIHVQDPQPAKKPVHLNKACLNPIVTCSTNNVVWHLAIPFCTVYEMFMNISSVAQFTRWRMLGLWIVHEIRSLLHTKLTNIRQGSITYVVALPGYPAPVVAVLSASALSLTAPPTGPPSESSQKQIACG